MKNLFYLIILFLSIPLISCNSGNKINNWNETKQENTISSYTDFLTNNPETEHKDSILLLIMELEWSFAKTENNIEALNSFSLKYPNSKKYSDSINDLKDGFIYSEVKIENTIEAYRKFREDYPKSTYRGEAYKKIEILRWQEVNKNKNNKEYIKFLVEYSMSKYIDSIKIKFKLIDFKGYTVFIEANEKDETRDIYERIILNFNTNETLIGKYEGFQEEQNYSAAWSGEIRGKFNKDFLIDIENRLTDFGDAYEFKPEPWESFDLIFDDDDNCFIRYPRKYEIVDITEMRSLQ